MGKWGRADVKQRQSISQGDGDRNEPGRADGKAEKAQAPGPTAAQSCLGETRNTGS